MTKRERLFSIWKLLGLLVVVSAVFTGVALGQVALEGDFEGTMVGYGEEANGEAGDAPNEIAVEGSFTVDGEPIEDVEIEVTSGEYTVLDTSSVQLRVPGEGIAFNTSLGRDQVTKSTGQLPEGTEVELAFSVYYIGDGDSAIANDTIDAADINVDYRTLGGSSGDRSFDAETEVSNRAESVIADRERGSQLSTVQEILSYVGGFTLVVLGLYILIYVGKQIAGDDKRKKPPR